MVDIIELLKAYAAPIASLIGVLIGVAITVALHELKNRRERKQAVNRSLSKVLEASYGIYSFYDDPNYTHLLTAFNFERYKEVVRPALYENYPWLPKKMRLLVFDIDKLVFDPIDNEFVPHKKASAMKKKYDLLNDMIERHFKLPRSS